MRFYSLYPEENDRHGIAYVPEGVTFKLLYLKKVIEDWRPIEFTLRDGDFADYQWNNMGWHMCAEKLKTLLVECAGPDDKIQWLPATVADGAGERRAYHILHLPEPVDVLSKGRTIMSGQDLIVKPVLDASKVGSRSIFTYSLETGRVYVNESTRRRIRAAKITGLDFLKVPAIPSE